MNHHSNIYRVTYVHKHRTQDLRFFCFFKDNDLKAFVCRVVCICPYGFPNGYDSKKAEQPVGMTSASNNLPAQHYFLSLESIENKNAPTNMGTSKIKQD